jgi:hypothetical protein
MPKQQQPQRHAWQEAATAIGQGQKAENCNASEGCIEEITIHKYERMFMELYSGFLMIYFL